MNFTGIFNKFKKIKGEENQDTSLTHKIQVSNINSSPKEVGRPKNKEVVEKVAVANQTSIKIYDINTLATPINDYKYKEIALTLSDQRNCFREEKAKLQKVSRGIEIYSKYLNKLSKLEPLAKSADLYNYPQIKGIEGVIPLLKNELSLFLSEYNKAIKIASKATFNARVGLAGENVVDKEIDLYRDKILNLSSIRLEVEDTTVESDNIVLSDNGVFCIEVKNYGGNHRGSKVVVTKDGLWHRYSAEGEEMEISDITSQIYRHIGITQRFVNEKLREKHGDISYVDFYPIIVFPNNSISIENHSDLPILRVSHIYHHISTFDSKGLDKRYREDISDILNDNNKGAKPYPVKLCADKLLENYKKVYFKLKVLSEIEKKYNLEKIFQGEIYIVNSRLFGMLEQYKTLNNIAGRPIKHLEIITLQALLDELHMKGSADRGVYVSLILNSFDVDNLSSLNINEYEHIYKCLNLELRNR
jgi:hypothetical protein